MYAHTSACNNHIVMYFACCPFHVRMNAVLDFQTNPSLKFLLIRGTLPSGLTGGNAGSTAREFPTGLVDAFHERVRDMAIWGLPKMGAPLLRDFPLTIQLWGYPHGHGNPHMAPQLWL